jgi:hypothetical protein
MPAGLIERAGRCAQPDMDQHLTLLDLSEEL